MMEFSSFRYDYTQARIVILWRLGIKNRMWLIAFFPIMTLAVMELLRFMGLYYQRLQFNMMNMSAYAIWTIFIVFLNIMIHMQTQQLMKKENRIAFTEDSLLVEGLENRMYRTSLTDILHADVGKQIMRIYSISGAGYIPVGLVPEIFLCRLEQRLEKNFRRRIWM